jgi:NADPH:quinone reductase-like Zn-dependent oxidoreductase
MRAVVIDTLGGPEVLRESEVETPKPGPGQVHVGVRVAGVNPFDARVRSGEFPRPLPAILGVEVAGTVDALRRGRDRLRGR